MRHRLGLIPLALLAGTALVAAPPRFVQTPDVRGDQVVFTWDGDLWKTSLQGGQAQRLTSHPGVESHARLSPDGQWIAFSASYDGGLHVYVIPATGGTPKRLTWRSGARVQGWTPDGKKVLFRAAVEAEARPVNRLYTVDLEGHEPEALPLAKAVQGAFASDGRLAFSTKGNEDYYWKRYKGGDAQDLWIGDLKTRRFEPLTDYVGKNAYPMWAGSQVLFVSDRETKGIANLFALDPGTRAVQRLTGFEDFDVQQPATDGRTVVFAQAGYLTAMDVTTRKTWRIPVETGGDDWRRRPRTLNPQPWIQSQALGTAGRSMALEARGDVFVVNLEGKTRPQNLTATPGVRERLPVLSPDGSRVAYFSDETGDYDLYVRPAAGGTATRIPTGLTGTKYRLAWSPDGKKLLFGDPTFALHLVDVEKGRITKLASSQVLQNDQFFWEQADYTWAPDSTWIAYTFFEPNRNGRIWLHNTETGERIPVTNGFYSSLNPAFDADGSRLYFLSHSGYQVVMDPSQDNHIQNAPVQVMSVLLRTREETSSLKSSKAGGFQVEAEGLQDRVAPLPVKAGNLFHLKAGRGVVGWTSQEVWDEPAQEELLKPKGQDKWGLHLFDVTKGQDVSMPGTVSDWGLSPDGTALLVKKGTDLHAGPLSAALGAKALPPRLDLSGLAMTVDPVAEWTQVWADTWRWYRDFFYDKEMHGNDWKAIGEKFKAWIPECPSRADLNGLLSQMVGELCVGHTYVSGGDVTLQNGGAPSLTFTGLLGADLEAANGGYRFTKIFGPTPYNRDLQGPLASPAPLVKEGDYLVAIDGRPIAPPEAIHKHLQITRNQKVKLTVNTKPSLEGARVIEVEPTPYEGELRYHRWVADSIATVEKLSEGQLGYMHITAMSEQNLGEFDKYWRAFRHRKGIVVDVRGNGGGWTEFMMIDKLERKQVGFNNLRGMLPFRYPGTAGDGRYVFLSNEKNGSDGEAFLAHVKARNLGTIVGTPSWGGLVGIINTQTTIDGGSVEQPNNAFYGATGRWWIENEGALPDLRVENGPDPRDGDRQLRTAVETLLKQLKEQPTPGFPEKPAYPKR